MIDFKVIRFPHGYFKGGLSNKDYCPTIDASVDFQHILIAEIHTEVNDEQPKA